MIERKIDKVTLFEGEEYLTCEEVITFLFEYLAGEVSAERAAEFERHLSICPSCVAYLESYRETIRLGREASRTEERPPELAAELMRAILASRPPRD